MRTKEAIELRLKTFENWHRGKLEVYNRAVDKKDYELAKELRSELEFYIGAISTIEWILEKY